MTALKKCLQIFIMLSPLLLAACGSKSAQGINYEAITPQRNNALTMDNRGSAVATWFVDGTLYTRRFDAAAGWTAPQTLSAGVDGEMSILDAAMTFDQATVVWEETPGSGTTRNSYALQYINGIWDAAPTQINASTPGADPAVAANKFSAQPYLAAITWNELANGTNTTSGTSFQTLVPRYREQNELNNTLSNTTVLGGVPEQAWLADNLDVAVDGQSNAFIAWTRRYRLPDDTEVHGVLVARKVPGGPASEERLIGFGESITNVQIVADLDGNARAFWLDGGRLYNNRYSIAQGNWRDADGTEQVVTQTNITDYAVSNNAAGRMAVAWVVDGDSVHAATLFPNGGLSAEIAFGLENIQDLGIGIADNHNMRLVVQRNGQLYSANYVENTVTWRTLSRVDDIGTGKMSFVMDGSETAIAIWDLDEGTDIGRQVWVAGAPNVEFSVAPNPATVDEVITFDANASTAENGIAGYQWDFDNDNTIDSTGGPVVTHSFAASGTYTARLRVVDNVGLFNEATQTITVTDPVTSEQYTLTVSTNMTGRVTSSPAGIDCGGDCSEMYAADTSVRLTAETVAGFMFDNWSGDCLGDGNFNMTTVVMDADKNCVANYIVNNSNSLAVSVTGGGNVSSNNGDISCGSDCFEEYPDPGTEVELFATPDPGWLFEQWSGDCVFFASDPAHAFATVTGDISCDATFVVPNNPVMLTVNISAEPGRVFEPYAGLDCSHSGGATPTTCTAIYDSGMSIELRVDSLSTADWIEGCDNIIPVDPINGVFHCALQINSDTTATITFR